MVQFRQAMESQIQESMTDRHCMQSRWVNEGLNSAEQPEFWLLAGIPSRGTERSKEKPYRSQHMADSSPAAAATPHHLCNELSTLQKVLPSFLISFSSLMYIKGGFTYIRRRCRFDPWVRKIPWRRKWQPTPVFLPGKFYGQRSLAGYSPWGHRKSDMTEWLGPHMCI